MKHKALLSAVFVSSVFLSGCAFIRHSQVNNNPNSIPIVNTQQTLAPFNKLMINGPVHIVFTQQQAVSSPLLRIVGPTGSVGNIVAEVRQNTLQIRSLRNVPSKEQPTVTAYVNGPELNHIIFNSNGTLTAKNLNTRYLNVTINAGEKITLSGKHIGLQQLTVYGPTPVNITGINASLLNVHAERAADISLVGSAGLSNLDYYGPGTFSLYWVNSEHVTIRSHQGRIVLGGIAKTTDITLSREAQVDARYLRTRSAFVNTADNARADIWTSQKLNAFASGASNIYYYKAPKLLTKYMRQNGSVLEMHSPVKACTDTPCKLEINKSE